LADVSMGEVEEVIASPQQESCSFSSTIEGSLETENCNVWCLSHTETSRWIHVKLTKLHYITGIIILPDVVIPNYSDLELQYTNDNIRWKTYGNIWSPFIEVQLGLDI